MNTITLSSKKEMIEKYILILNNCKYISLRFLCWEVNNRKWSESCYTVHGILQEYWSG